MSGLMDTTEMYLKTIYELVEENIPPLRARIVERLNQSGPTVSETVARLERDGLLIMGDNREIVLTTDGLRKAASVLRRHRLAEVLLVDVIKVPWGKVHNEACRWEHAISEDVAERISALLNNPTHDPFGNPIPAADELAPDTVCNCREGLVSLADPATAGHDIVIERIAEVAQLDESSLEKMAEYGLFPGVAGAVSSDAERVVQLADRSVTVPEFLAKHIYVTVK